MKNKLLIAALTAGALFSTALHAQTTFYDITDANTFFTYKINDLLVYPNPVFSNTCIVLPVASISTVTVDVVDLNGNIVRTFKYAPGIYNLDVDMSRLPTGIYSVRVSGKDIEFHNLKVVKQ